MDLVFLILKIVAFFLFIALIWPHIKAENWREKFIENKHAFSLIIVFILILLLILGITFTFDTLFPVETLD